MTQRFLTVDITCCYQAIICGWNHLAEQAPAFHSHITHPDLNANHVNHLLHNLFMLYRHVSCSRLKCGEYVVLLMDWIWTWDGNLDSKCHLAMKFTH